MVFRFHPVNRLILLKKHYAMLLIWAAMVGSLKHKFMPEEEVRPAE
jgi:hypothetical protein